MLLLILEAVLQSISNFPSSNLYRCPLCMVRHDYFREFTSWELCQCIPIYITLSYLYIKVLPLYFAVLLYFVYEWHLFQLLCLTFLINMINVSRNIPPFAFHSEFYDVAVSRVLFRVRKDVARMCPAWTSDSKIFLWQITIGQYLFLSI